MNKYLIDTRTQAEFEISHMEGAMNFDVQRLMARELPNIPKEAEIELYCRSGQRSEVDKQILLQQGFINVKNIGSFED